MSYPGDKAIGRDLSNLNLQGLVAEEPYLVAWLRRRTKSKMSRDVASYLVESVVGVWFV